LVYMDRIFLCVLNILLCVYRPSLLVFLGIFAVGWAYIIMRIGKKWMIKLGFNRFVDIHVAFDGYVSALTNHTYSVSDEHSSRKMIYIIPVFVQLIQSRTINTQIFKTRQNTITVERGGYKFLVVYFVINLT
jgi:hypothetical protein